MDRTRPRDVITALAGTVLLMGLAGCAVRRGDNLAPTALQPCPSWVEFPAATHSNLDSVYLGCTNHVNIQTMLDRPADLEHGRPLGPAGGERESLAVDTYNQGKTRLSKDSSNGATPTVIMPAAVGGGGP
jgi:type IV pilus biogenesis protein CpaD/CtpE